MCSVLYDVFSLWSKVRRQENFVNYFSMSVSLRPPCSVTVPDIERDYGLTTTAVLGCCRDYAGITGSPYTHGWKLETHLISDFSLHTRVDICLFTGDGDPTKRALLLKSASAVMIASLPTHILLGSPCLLTLYMGSGNASGWG